MPAFPLPPSPFSRRAGISLLEVLVSIAVLLGGLLVVAMLIPVAGLRIIQTNQADYSAACGQAGLRDVKVRRMLEPREWLRWSPSDGNFVEVSEQEIPTDPSTLGIPFVWSYAIDPLGYAYDLNDDGNVVGAMRRFPYYGGSNQAMMRRITLEVPSYANPFPPPPPKPDPLAAMPFQLADRIFTWHDDLAIATGDAGDRPQAMMIQDASNNDLALQIQGKYSWLVTVTPEVASEDFNGSQGKYHYAHRNRLYSVSVVVFFNRDFSPPPPNSADPDVPGERIMSAKILGDTLYGGGDVRLFAPPFETDSDNDGTPDTDINGNGITDYGGPGYLDIKEGHWLMLGLPASPPAVPRDIFRWYRVVAAGETLSEDLNGDGTLDPTEDLNANNEIDWFREVSVAGPDWDFGADVDAALFTRVIGVYTKTIELDDLGSLWAN